MSAEAPAGDASVLADIERALSRVARTVSALRVPQHLGPSGVGLPAGIDRAGYAVLDRVAESAPVRLSDLAGTLGLDPSTVSRQVRHLDDGGLVERQPDPGDGRACRIAPSELGRQVLDAIRCSRQAVLGSALAHWSEADRVTLAALLRRLARDVCSGLPVPTQQPAPDPPFQDLAPSAATSQETSP